MFSISKVAAISGLVVVAAGFVGCGSDEPDAGTSPGGGTGGNVSGTVIVDGSSTVFRISKAAQEAFEAVNAKITIVVDNHGTGGGFGRYLQGEVDIVDASRKADQTEESKAKARGSSGPGSSWATTASRW